MGTPVIENITPEMYNGSAQVWTVSQDKMGFMYFGVNEGLIVYIGSDYDK